MTLSFEGAEGYGAEATGGRGGEVIIVTTSADSGEGSLRWALEEFDGPRTIVFEVNEVNLTSDISLRDGDVTIAGQTAGGVQVTGATINIKASNVIMRGMMFRPGDGTDSTVDPDSRDGLKINGGSGAIENIIIDHNSFEWAIDENVDIWKTVSNLTFSNNIVAQGLLESLHSKGEHSMGMLISGSEDPAHHLSIFDNLFAFNHHRNPRVGDGNHIEIVNNYVYGSGEQPRTAQVSDINGQNAEYVNFISNYFEAGPETPTSSLPGIKIDTDFNYVNGNLHFDADGNQLSSEYHGGGSDGLRSSPDFGSGLTIMDAYDVPAYVLANAGANPGDRDSVDQNIVDLVAAGEGGLVNSVAEAGGYADTPYTAPADTDRDGMPDWFEDAYGFDKNQFDANGDSDGDGYTNLEEYINGLYTGFNLGGTGGGSDPNPIPQPDPIPQPEADPGPLPGPLPDTEPKNGLLMIDAITDQTILAIESGDMLSNDYVQNANLTLAYIPTVSGIGSVRLDFNDGQWTRVENSSPYALFGDNSSDYAPTQIGAIFPRDDDYSIEVTLYSERGGNGTILGTETYSFSVGTTSDVPIDDPIAEDPENGGPGSTDDEPPQVAFEKHINVGGARYETTDGIVFEADPGIDSGSYVTRIRNNDVLETQDDALYQSYGFGNFAYDIDVPDGTYEVTLYLMEPWARSEGRRIFDVSLEGESAKGTFDDIDLYEMTGGKWQPLILHETVEVNDGSLDIDLAASVNNGIVSAISVLELL